jgi:MFS family permease
MATERPFGVTILAILAIIEALVAFGAAALVGTMFAWMESMIPGGFFAGMGLIIAGVVAIFGIIYLIIGWGLWTGQGWAWTVMLIFAILGLIGSIIGLIAIVGIVPLIINILILYYLTRPHVKAFFRKGPPAEAPPAPPP